MNTQRENIGWCSMGVTLLFVGMFITMLTSSAEAGQPSSVANSVQPFRDVAANSTHRDAIAALVEAGITRGCTPHLFCVGSPVTREQMATFIARALNLPPSSNRAFADVSRTSVHAPNIASLQQVGLVGGCSDQSYCPNAEVTRAQVASVLSRALELTPTGKHSFLDMEGSTHEGAVLALADAEITLGCSATAFCGHESVTRGQFASLLSRALAKESDSLKRFTESNLASSDPVEPVDSGGKNRLLYSGASVAGFRVAMSGEGAFYSTGDAGHGDQYSPGDGQRAEQLTAAFLADPSASYWSQPNLPYTPGDPRPNNTSHLRPMFAAWVYMTQPDHPSNRRLQSELKKLLLVHADDPTLDYSNSSNYSNRFHGAAVNPIFETAQWMSRLMKARDMVGRDAFTDAENAKMDEWFLGYANWSASWLHKEAYVKALPGRLQRDYSQVAVGWSKANGRPYDGGPSISTAALAYTNRHAAVASTMSLAANYLKHYDYRGTTKSVPSYGVYSVDELLHHSRLFVEETLRFSVYPQGFQGDFVRGDLSFHSSSSPQQGWLYSINVLANVLEIAEYHAARGDLSVWKYGTVEGFAGSQGQPVAGGFDHKSLHFFAWSMSRYANSGWNRTNRGEPLVLERFYHDVLPAAMASRFAPNDALLEAAWKRQGHGFSAYPHSPQSQGPYHAHNGDGSKMIGLIEHTTAAKRTQ